MADALERYPLSDYDNPPVVETVLGVQFDRLSAFRNAHLGAFWRTLDADRWPVVQDMPLLPTQFERFAEATPWAEGVQLQLTQDPACRLQIRNQAGDRMIQLQNNRLHFNWFSESGGEYPRYEIVREEFLEVLRQFVIFVEQANVGDFRPNQWEVTYVNHIPQGSVWKTPSEWGFFEPLGGIPTIGNLLEGESFGGEWHFVIPDQKGRLHIQWRHAVASKEAEKELVRLVFTARGKLEDGENQHQTILDCLDLGRKTIVLSFKELMSEEANKHWGIKHASD